MKKLLIVSMFVLGTTGPSSAWYDSYGGFTCGYLDPLTSFLDSIFGPPCPAPVPVPVPVAQPVQVSQAYPSYQSYPQTPRTYAVPVPAPPRTGARMQTSSCGPYPCGYGGVGGGNVGPNVGNGLGIPPYIYDSGIGAPNIYALPY